eukprot:gene16215-22379_t
MGHMGLHDPALVTWVTWDTWVFMIQQMGHIGHMGHMGLHDPALVTLVSRVTWFFMIHHWSHGPQARASSEDRIRQHGLPESNVDSRRSWSPEGCPGRAAGV